MQSSQSSGRVEYTIACRFFIMCFKSREKCFECKSLTHMWSWSDHEKKESYFTANLGGWWKFHGYVFEIVAKVDGNPLVAQCNIGDDIAVPYLLKLDIGLAAKILITAKKPAKRGMVSKSKAIVLKNSRSQTYRTLWAGRKRMYSTRLMTGSPCSPLSFSTSYAKMELGAFLPKEALLSTVDHAVSSTFLNFWFCTMKVVPWKLFHTS